MTHQEIFDTIVKGILSQGGASSWAGRCKYRDNRGRKCAAGWLIPDKLYDSEMDRNGSIYSNDLVKNLFISLGLDFRFLNSMQSIHDNCSVSTKENDKEFLENWKQEMIKFADKNCLSSQVFADCNI